MSLDNLSASELAKIDSVCLEYESDYRRGNAPEISEIVSQHDGPHAEVLRRELELVRDELQSGETIGPNDAKNQTINNASFRIPAPGTELGPYVVGQPIGQGGMGLVFSATDQRLGRRVAIKMLAADFAQRNELTERFDREARSVANLSHPNIVELFDVGSHNGLPYAVMEFLDGELLSDRLDREPLTVSETRSLGAQIADALAKAHQAGVIHRDLKPQNVMLVAASTASDSHKNGSARHGSLVKLFDFGLSRAPRAQDDSADGDTEEGVILGTPGYMAPEQALGEPATAAADIFALGCILYEAFYGKRAFAGDSRIKRHQATLADSPLPDPIKRRQDPRLADLIDRCLAKDPDNRPSSAAEIAQQLRHANYDPVAESLVAGESAGRFTRRRLLELTTGAAAGTAFAVILANQKPNKFADVNRIGVLTFVSQSDAVTQSTNPAAQPDPIGAAKLKQGEELSAMLVHELTKIPSVTVPPFRPLAADTQSDYRQVGQALNVDALIDGTIRTETQGEKTFLAIDVRLISARDGSQLWGKQYIKDADESLLQQSQIAAEIASEIGYRLTASANTAAPPTATSFSCLVDGKVRCDPDSREGLKKAMMCFRHAKQQDPRFSEPLAGIALTAITLASQSSEREAAELMRTAQEEAEDALRLSKDSFDARLALAMLNWQRNEQYQQAERSFQTLLKQQPNNWQVHHQYGLLQLATGRFNLAIESLNSAALSNPFSVTVKTDLARAYWFSGNTDRAIEDAIRIRDKSNRHVLSVGLLIDIYEQQGNFSDAAAQDAELQPGDLDSYLRRREQRLIDIPYGPYGDELNAAILQSRMESALSDDAIADLIDSPRPPRLPLVLAMHPSFAKARQHDRAKELLSRLDRREQRSAEG